jgi:hypothetical protein
VASNLQGAFIVTELVTQRKGVDFGIVGHIADERPADGLEMRQGWLPECENVPGAGRWASCAERSARVIVWLA